MANLSLINSKTVLNRVMQIAKIGLGITILQYGISFNDSWVKTSEFSSRKGTLEKVIAMENVFQATDIVESYQKAGFLEEAEVKLYLTRINEINKKKEISKLNELIQTYRYKEAVTLFNELNDKKIIDAESFYKLRSALIKSSEENLAMHVQSTVGKTKIGWLEYYISLYPNTNTAQKFRAEIMPTYISTIDSLVNVHGDEKIISNLLEQFKLYLKKVDKKSIENTNFENIFSNIQNYVISEKERSIGRNTQLYIGDEVQVVKTLGYIKGKENSEYYYDKNTTQIPLNTTGIITQIGSDNAGSYQVYFFDKIKTQYWFQRREIMPLISQDLSHIDLHLAEIKSYVQKVKNNK